VLPLNSSFGGAYYRNDVPGYLQLRTFFDGYEGSSYIFDYLADQTAYGGGDWIAAVNDFVVHAGAHTDINAAVGRAQAGLDFDQLMTRARIALYLDDYDAPALPPWTQYHMYDLRRSRPAGGQPDADPRNAWPRYTPGSGTLDEHVAIASGMAWGFVIDGRSAAASALIDIQPGRVPNGVIAVTRIR
jgi:hypothetical protein